MSGSSGLLGLGEIVLWVNDLRRMREFYRDVIGLPLMDAEMRVLQKTVPDAFEKYAFFRISDDPAGGHGEFLALFDAGKLGHAPVDAAHSSFYHLALRFRLERLEQEAGRLEDMGLQVTRKTFQFIRCRSVFLDDPEGNQIELVADDPAVR